MFTDHFIEPLSRLESLRQSPLFNIKAKPAFKLNKEQQRRLTDIFEAMIANEATDYLYKDDLLRNYIQLLVHSALQMDPSEHFLQFSNASSRICTQFMELLEQQFPIENMSDSLKFKNAQDFAHHLSIHVNSLNRAVKEITDKTTTELIAERIVAEAISLLRYTDWNIADIAFALGFDYPNYFSSFFKKITGHTPGYYRNPLV